VPPCQRVYSDEASRSLRRGHERQSPPSTSTSASSISRYLSYSARTSCSYRGIGGILSDLFLAKLLLGFLLSGSYARTHGRDRCVMPCIR